MDKIILINEGASDNIGDQALNLGLFKLLSNLGFNISQVDFTRCVESDSENMKKRKPDVKKNIQVKGSQSKLRLNLSRGKWFVRHVRKVWRYLGQDVDNVVIGGGQLVLDNRYFPIAMFTWISIAKIKRKPVYLISVGVGKRFSLSSRLLIGFSFNMVDGFIVRDEVSQRNLRKNFGVNSESSYDSAYILNNLSNGVKNVHEPRLVLGVTNYNVYKRYNSELNLEHIFTKSEYIKEWVALIKIKNINRIIFCSTSSEDIKISFEVYKMLINTYPEFDVVFLGHIPSLSSYIDILSNSTCTISGRMHALILSELVGNEVNPWVISQKLDTYNRLVLPMNVNFKCDHLTSKVKDLMLRD